METDELLSVLNRLIQVKETFTTLLVDLKIHKVSENLADEIVKGMIKVENAIILVKLELKNASKLIDQC